MRASPAQLSLPDGRWYCCTVHRTAGLPKVYRQCVEILFRAGHLRLIIATGTLAFGINMCGA